VLRAIASSPHDLQPVFQTIIDSAMHLCRAEWGACRLAEEGGFRLVATNQSPAVLAQYTSPMLYEHGSFIGRLYASKSPVHIPDLAAEIRRAGETDPIDVSVSKAGARTCLFAPMLRNDELIALGLIILVALMATGRIGYWRVRSLSPYRALSAAA
jgi:hypothetical protein